MFPRQQSLLDIVVRGWEMWLSWEQGSDMADVDDDIVVLKGRGKLEDVL